MTGKRGERASHIVGVEMDPGYVPPPLSMNPPAPDDAFARKLAGRQAIDDEPDLTPEEQFLHQVRLLGHSAGQGSIPLATVQAVLAEGYQAGQAYALGRAPWTR